MRRATRWSAVLCLICWCGLVRGALAQPSARDVQNERVARLLARGEALREAGNAVSAVAYFRDAINAAPRRSEGYLALGQLYLQLDEPVRALEVFEVATRAAADHSEALWLGLAAALSKLGQEERALGTLRQLVQQRPTPLGLRALAAAAEARGLFLEALSARRALVDALLPAGHESDAARDELATERGQVRALELLLGAADRVRDRSLCGEPDASAITRALARCP
ncbi:MAG: hypothetical protein JWN04_3543 [Myxococcaceae bacterium]|nr:hypothetical protein [Myxococcaceae bacterium]